MTMTTWLWSRQLACALAAGVAGIVIIGQALHSSNTVSAAPAAVMADRGPASGFETDIPDRGAALMTACRSDAAQFCAQVTPGQGRIVSCLAARRDDVSDYCRSALLQRRFNRERYHQVMQD
jgi:Cysteine rich repeat